MSNRIKARVNKELHYLWYLNFFSNCPRLKGRDIFWELPNIPRSVNPRTYTNTSTTGILIWNSSQSTVILSSGAVALYPFTSASSERDVTRYRNPAAKIKRLSFIQGPDGHPQGAYYFPGIRRLRGRRSRGSYALIPNDGCLDTRYSITIIAWIYPEKPGPIVHYNPKGWGLHLWLTHVNELYFRLMPRRGSRRNVKPLTTRSLKPYTWNYISATYDHRTGLATLWINGNPVSQRNIGKFTLGLATDYPVVVGQRPGDRRVFRGRIACLQIYNVALKRAQIVARQKQCFRPGK